jgi:hypothetical protein
MADADGDAKLDDDLLLKAVAGDVRIGLTGVVYPGAELGGEGVKLAATALCQGEVALRFDTLEQGIGTRTAEGETGGGNGFLPGMAGLHQGNAGRASSAALVTIHMGLSSQNERSSSIADFGVQVAPVCAPASSPRAR